ncbi:hypothetical protein JOB18_024691 [Solea senegalensis]|uniref:Uncharacterized protein n=1 Tax=Solea senegalensis TaxID=28829 RepID=A0AAV6SZF9_SOLSE|nr:hypothetical protein JOB18_024691 [Solea senegalensis]
MRADSVRAGRTVRGSSTEYKYEVWTDKYEYEQVQTSTRRSTDRRQYEYAMRIKYGTNKYRRVRVQTRTHMRISAVRTKMRCTDVRKCERTATSTNKSKV